MDTLPAGMSAKAEPDTTMPPVETTAAQPDQIPDSALLAIGEGLTEDNLTFFYGKKKTLTLDVVNWGGVAAHSISLTPVFSNHVSDFPCKITRIDWTQSVTNASDEALLPEGLTLSDLSALPDGCNKGYASFVFDVRSDAPSGYYPLRFTVNYTENGQIITRELVLQVLIKTSAMGRNKTLIESPDNTAEPRPEISCTTLPQQVMAGEPFTLTLTVTNPSADRSMDVLRLSAVSVPEGVFLPVAGSTTLFIDSLAPGISKTLTLEMNTPSDLAPRQYALALKTEYSDGNAELYTLENTFTIPVHQPAELSLSDITLVPEEAIVGEPLNLMVNLYNTGNTQLNNVLVRLESEGSVRSEDYFAGNMAAGATSMMDVLITPLRSGDLSCTLLVSYEDQMGRSCQTQKSFSFKALLSESSTANIVIPPPPPENEDPLQEEEYPSWFMSAFIAAAILLFVLLVIIIIVIRRRNRKHIRRNMDHYLDNQ